MTAVQSYHFENGFHPTKSGKPGKRFGIVAVTKVCPVVQCEQCGRLGSPTWTRRWYMRPAIRFNEEFDREPALCMGCMNRFRPYWKAQCDIREAELLIGRIKREITRVNAQNHR